MSFRCDHCDEPQVSGTRPSLRVVETRQREYRPRIYEIGSRKVDDPGGFGSEIVKEVRLCEHCDCSPLPALR